MRRGQQARSLRKETADQLSTERSKRTPEEQLAKLDSMLGDGVGAKKERARLHRQIEDGLAGGTNKPGNSKVPKTRSARRKEKAKRNAAKQAKAT
jgi:hypothetical protein